ncbi:MAG: P-loop NTPase [Candidatus Omnitrophica bacterium]|nr:P-loop NTPase [Candidatus Omnitrophota bacterium]
MSTNPFSLSGVKHTIAISSCKGGVGKSTIAAALAWELARRGFKTGLLDTDIYGPSLPSLFQLNHIRAEINEFKMVVPVEHKGLKLMSFGFLLGDAPAVMRGPMVANYIKQLLFQTDWGELDYLLLDMPPGTGDVQLTITQLIKLTGAVIVTTHHTLSLVDAARGILMFEKVKVPILGVIENMAYFTAPDTGKRYYIFGEQKAKSLSSRFGVKTLVEIPILEGLCAGMSDFQKNPYIQEAGDEFVEAIKHIEASQSHLKDAVFKEGQVVLTFSDGRVLSAPAFDLRAHCPCAGCVSEMTGQRLVDVKKIPSDIFPREILPLGNYAVGISWSDGHSSGIYPYTLFEHLKH